MPLRFRFLVFLFLVFPRYLERNEFRSAAAGNQKSLNFLSHLKPSPEEGDEDQGFGRLWLNVTPDSRTSHHSTWEDTMSAPLTQLDNIRDSQTPLKTPPARDWRFPLTMGLAIGLALPAARGVRNALEPSLGSEIAFLLSLVVAGAVSGLVGSAVSWLIKARKGAN
jgi:hypothetical protein